MFRSGTVALIGRANVGKSTFLNTALGEPLAIVSACPQTTRDALLGVVTREAAEFALLDSPGLHRPHNELGRRMNLAATDAMHRADFALVFIDVTALSRHPHAHPGRVAPSRAVVSEEDARIIEMIPKAVPWAIVLNKVDQVKDKSQLLPLLSDLATKYPDHEIIPISSLSADDVERVLRVIEPAMPERPARYDAETLTDRPMRYFAAEYIREQVMRTTRGELPFAIAVAIDEFSELPDKVHIQATISVEKDGQRVILIGHKGHQIREIGTSARKRIAHLLQKKVHLQLFVRTSKRWKDNQTILTELGYAVGTGTQSRSSESGEP